MDSAFSFTVHKKMLSFLGEPVYILQSSSMQDSCMLCEHPSILSV